MSSFGFPWVAKTLKISGTIWIRPSSRFAIKEKTMNEKIKIGIIICDRYRSCAGGKCFRALRERAGAFAAYAGEDVELVGFTSCGGCPGGNIESSPEEMKKNGAQVIHLATGFLVGYPPCPHIDHFR